LEELRAQTIEAAKTMRAVTTNELRRVIVDTTVQEKAVAHPTDSRLLEIARQKLVKLAQQEGITLRQSYEREGPKLRRRAGGYAHAKQFKRLKRVLRRQRTVLGRVIRDIERKIDTATATTALRMMLERAERLRIQHRKAKNKLYALHAPEVECLSKGKSRQPYEFGVKVGIAITARGGLIVDARSFPRNPYDGDTLAEQLEQAEILSGEKPLTVIVDLGYRGRALKAWRFCTAVNPNESPDANGHGSNVARPLSPSSGILKRTVDYAEIVSKAHSVTRCTSSRAPLATTCAGCCAGSHFFRPRFYGSSQESLACQAETSGCRQREREMFRNDYFSLITFAS
jgi:hypothetical protein